MVTSAMSHHTILNSAARFTGLPVGKCSPILCIGIAVSRAIQITAYRNNWLFRYRDRQISRYKSGAAIAAPVTICFANQEEKQWSLRESGVSESGVSKRKLGRALLCLPYASLRGFYVSSGDTLGRFRLCNKRKQDTVGYPVYKNKGIAA